MSRTRTHKASASIHPTTPTREIANAVHAALAFAAVEPEILAVPANELMLVNLDVPRAAGRGRLATKRLMPVLPALSLLPDFDIERIKRLGVYALALHHAHDLATEVGAGGPTLPILLGEATPLREGMLRSAELLAHYGVVSEERVAAIRSGHGHADLADDLIALGRLYDDSWKRVIGMVPVTREMVDRAPVLGAQIHEALAERELEESPLVQPKSRRFVEAQAFTLFARVYDEARRGVTYLRWNEGDAHLFVPSLYPHRPRRSSMVVDEPTNEDVIETSTDSDSDAMPAPTAASELVADP